MSDFPRLLLMCDMPPSSSFGGPVLIGRLLQHYPPECVTILCSSAMDARSPQEGRLDAGQVAFPSTTQTGPHGWGRIKSALDWLSIPVLTVMAASLIRRHRIQVIVTVPMGHFFVGAAFASILSQKPLVFIVHDDWPGSHLYSYLMKYLAPRIFGWALRRASHIYAVSPEMQAYLQQTFGLTSELQLPAVDVPPVPVVHGPKEITERPALIGFTGALSGMVLPGLETLVGIITSGQFQADFPPGAELRIFTPTHDAARLVDLSRPEVRVRILAPRSELEHGLAEADVLFLPLAFDERARYLAETSFPSKLAEYLRAGAPILVHAPPWSVIARYARETGCAEVIGQPDEDTLRAALAALLTLPEKRRELVRRARETLERNHDIAVQRESFRQTVVRLAAQRRRPGMRTRRYPEDA